MLERDTVAARQRFEIGMIGGDHHNVDGEFPGSPPIQQIHEAVIVFRDENKDSRSVIIGADSDMSVEGSEAGLEQILQGGFIGLGRVERGAHAEQVGERIAELMIVNDVALNLEQCRAHGVHDAGLIRAGQRQNVSGHDALTYPPSCGMQLIRTRRPLPNRVRQEDEKTRGVYGA